MRNLFKYFSVLVLGIVIYKLKSLFNTGDIILADPMTAAAGIGGAIGLGKDVFGSASKQSQNQRAFTQFRPEDLQRIEQARGGYQQSTQGLLDQLQRSQAALSQGYKMPISDFQYSASPDAMTRALASQAGQGIAQQAAAQRAQIASQFRGQPGAMQALQRQADIQSRLQQNPLLFQAFQQQQGRELSQAQQNLANTEAANRALLGREQALTGFAGTGVSANQNLMSNLLSLGQALGEQIQQGQMQGRSGGLVAK